MVEIVEGSVPTAIGTEPQHSKNRLDPPDHTPTPRRHQPRAVAFNKNATVKSSRISMLLGIEAAAAALVAAVRGEIEARGRISFSEVNSIWVTRTHVGLTYSDGSKGCIAAWRTESDAERDVIPDHA
jgi:hypothetical protein